MRLGQIRWNNEITAAVFEKGGTRPIPEYTMQGLIERLWLAHRCTRVLVTHDVSEAVALADRVVLVEDGQVALDVPIALPRSRDHAHSGFVRLEHTILRRVLQGPDGQEAAPAVAEPATIHFSQLNWAL